MAWAAAYVALDVARGVASTHRASAWRATYGASFALAVAAWASHLIVMADDPLPFALGYHAPTIFGALALAQGVMAASIGLGAGAPRNVLRWALAAILFAMAACAAPVASLFALRIDAGLQIQPLWLVAGCALSAVFAGVGLCAFAQRRRDATPLARFAWQAVAAMMLGVAVVVADAGVLQALQVAAEPSPMSLGRVASGTLTALAAVGVPVLLGVLLLSSVLEARFKETLRRARSDLERAAHTDPMTGLPNRAEFEEQLQAAAIKADRHQHRLALLFINLDNLKSVNESFGQAAGDRVLREIAERLKSMAGECERIARAGGDEFLVLLGNNPATADAAQLASQLLVRLQRPCDVNGQQVAVPCSIGIAMYPEHGAMTKLIAHSDAAMQSAKRTGGAAYCFFEARMVAGAREQMELLADLRRAVEHREFELVYQPKVHAPSGQVTGAEALMRWNHPKRGIVSPGVFIPMAERFGLIHALGNWLIEDVCRQIRAWREQGLRMRIAINLSVHQLRQPDLVQRITDALKRYRIEPGFLTCEITESTAMDDMKVTLAVLEQLKAVGVHVSIDDFGTGYSSLSYLRQLAAEELKIDRSFVLDLETSEDARAIVDAVVKLAQALGLKVVAEGVETRQQQEILRSLGCNELQGFLFARPMSAKALVLWATKDEGGPSALDFRASLFGDTMPAPV